MFRGVWVAKCDQLVFSSSGLPSASRSPSSRSRTCCLETDCIGGSPTLSRCTVEGAHGAQPEPGFQISPSPPVPRIPHEAGIDEPMEPVRRVAVNSHPRSGAGQVTCSPLMAASAPSYRPGAHRTRNSSACRTSFRPVRVDCPGLPCRIRVRSAASPTRKDSARGTALLLSPCSRSGYRPVSRLGHRGISVHSGRIPTGGCVT